MSKWNTWKLPLAVVDWLKEMTQLDLPWLLQTVPGALWVWQNQESPNQTICNQIVAKTELQLSSKPIPSKEFQGQRLWNYEIPFQSQHNFLSQPSVALLLIPGSCASCLWAQLPTEGLQPREWPVLGQGEGRGRRSSPEGLWDQPQPHPQGVGECFQFIFPFRNFGAAITGKPTDLFRMSFLCYLIQSYKRWKKRGKKKNIIWTLILEDLFLLFSVF